MGRLRAHGIFPQALRLQHGGMVSKQKSILRSTLPTLILPADGDTPWKFEATFKPGSALFMRCVRKLMHFGAVRKRPCPIY